MYTRTVHKCIQAVCSEYNLSICVIIITIILVVVVRLAASTLSRWLSTVDGSRSSWPACLVLRTQLDPIRLQREREREEGGGRRETDRDGGEGECVCVCVCVCDVPCYIHVYVCLSGLWLSRLLHLSFYFKS